jgi:hypothetical protein
MHIYHFGTLVEVAINLVTKRAYAYYLSHSGGGCQKNFNRVLCLAAPQLVDQLDACRILIDVRAECRKRCERKKERKKAQVHLHLEIKSRKESEERE